MRREKTSTTYVYIGKTNIATDDYVSLPQVTSDDLGQCIFIIRNYQN